MIRCALDVAVSDRMPNLKGGLWHLMGCLGVMLSAMSCPAQVFADAASIPDVFLFTGSAGDDWQEVEWTCLNPSLFPLSSLVVTRDILETNVTLNEGGAAERFCVGEICYLTGTQSSAPFSMGPFESIQIKPNYQSQFAEGAVTMRYCLHGASLPPESGVCHTLQFEYQLDGYVEGCTYLSALNFDAAATVDDGSCFFGSAGQAYDNGYQDGYEVGVSEVTPCPSDHDADGLITVSDLLGLLSVFGEVCD